MHIPDGFLDWKTASLSVGLAGAGLGWALRQARQSVAPAQVPLLGLTGAFVFAAQMVNFPVVGGTSGHLLGGVLASVLLGPSAAVVVLSAVLLVQCLLFNDGGLLALGANLFNLAIVAPVGGYAAFWVLRRVLRGTRGLVWAGAFAAWFSTVLAALSCAGQLALSGAAAWALVFPAMLNIHLVIGLVEGLITGLVLAALVRTRPAVITAGLAGAPGHSARGLAGVGLVASLGLALFVAPFASRWPDGLERVAARLGFVSQARPSTWTAPLADYHLPGIGSAVAATAWAGAIGTLLAFGLAWLLACWLVPKDLLAKPAARKAPPASAGPLSPAPRSEKGG